MRLSKPEKVVILVNVALLLVLGGMIWLLTVDQSKLDRIIGAWPQTLSGFNSQPVGSELLQLDPEIPEPDEAPPSLVPNLSRVWVGWGVIGGSGFLVLVGLAVRFLKGKKDEDKLR